MHAPVIDHLHIQMEYWKP